MQRNGYGIVIALGVVLVAAFSVASVGGAQNVTASFACPNDPKTQPLGKIYGKNRGSTFCNDGAKATAVVAGKKVAAFTGGLCWKSRHAFSVAIGTAIAGKRLKTDPPGFWLQDFKPGGLVKDSVDLGTATVSWSFTVKVTYAANKRSGTWSGAKPTFVGGKLTNVPAKGSFTCKRVLDAPDQ